MVLHFGRSFGRRPTGRQALTQHRKGYQILVCSIGCARGGIDDGLHTPQVNTDRDLTPWWVQHIDGASSATAGPVALLAQKAPGHQLEVCGVSSRGSAGLHEGTAGPGLLFWLELFLGEIRVVSATPLHANPADHPWDPFRCNYFTVIGNVETSTRQWLGTWAGARHMPRGHPGRPGRKSDFGTWT